ncbi:MAG: hypothetical protein IMW94_01420 [Thermoanaerobacter sp.]|jgi:hypothetical protein|nr:hypothetical protein [Thermoanaerobacter sp.]
MQNLVEELKSIGADQSNIMYACFGIVVSQDNRARMLKVELEPWGVETGWLRVLNWPYLHRHVEIRALDPPGALHPPVPQHGHDHCTSCYPDPDPVNPVVARRIEYDPDKDHRYPDEFARYNWVGQEVVVLMLYGDINSGVVLGPLW